MKTARIAVIIGMCITLMGTLVLASFAWFFASNQIESDDSGLEAAKAATIKVINFDQSTEDDKDKYQGQIGNAPVGEADSPYKLTRKFDIELVTIGTGTILSITFNKLAITTRSGDIIKPLKEEHFKMFTWRLVAASGGKQITYYPDSLGRARLLSGATLSGDGELYYVQSGAYTFTLSIIFLGESDYRKWEQATLPTDYLAIKPFAFSDIKYMKSIFDIALSLKLGAEAPSPPAP